MKNKLVLIISSFILCSLLFFISCKKEVKAERVNGIFLLPVTGSSASFTTENRTVLYSVIPYKFPFSAGILAPAATNLDVTIAVDNNLVSAYNTTQKTTYATMPDGSYTIEATSLQIPKDSLVSQKTNLVIKSNMLKSDVPYLLPVKVVSTTGTGVSLNTVMATKYYVITSPTPVIANLSNGKTSYWKNPSASYNPQRANDGNTNGDWTAGSVCESGAGAEQYWEVDLGGISPRIDTVRIWNRSDCCDDRTTDFYVFISDVPFSGTAVANSIGQAGVYKYYNAGKAGRPTQILPNVSGRYIRIQNTGGTSLTLAELTAIGIKP